jgi:uncharacterized protein Veg
MLNGCSLFIKSWVWGILIFCGVLRLSVAALHMRKIQFDIESVKKEIAGLKDRCVKMYINKGRKKIIVLSGRVVDVYPSVFTVKIEGSKSLDIQSYSFSEVLTGDVRVKALYSSGADSASAQSALT